MHQNYYWKISDKVRGDFINYTEGKDAGYVTKQLLQINQENTNTPIHRQLIKKEIQGQMAWCTRLGPLGLRTVWVPGIRRHLCVWPSSRALKGAGNGLSTWAPATHMGDPRWEFLDPSFDLAQPWLLTAFGKWTTRWMTDSFSLLTPLSPSLWNKSVGQTFKKKKKKLERAKHMEKGLGLTSY